MNGAEPVLARAHADRERDAYLVDQQDRVPLRSQLARASERAVDAVRASTQVTAADNVQGSPEVLARRLCGERLADAWRTEEADDETLTFAAHEVVERAAFVQFSVGLDERAEEVLARLRENETREHFLIPVYGGNMVDVEFD